MAPPRGQPRLVPRVRESQGWRLPFPTSGGMFEDAAASRVDPAPECVKLVGHRHFGLASARRSVLDVRVSDGDKLRTRCLREIHGLYPGT